MAGRGRLKDKKLIVLRLRNVLYGSRSYKPFLKCYKVIQVYTQTEGVERDYFIFKIFGVPNNSFCLLYKLEFLQFENSIFRDRF